VELTHADHSNPTVDRNHLEGTLEFLRSNEEEWEGQRPENNESDKLVGRSRHV
jgi:hypothetical protein